MEELLYSIYSDDPSEIFYKPIESDFVGWIDSMLENGSVDKSWGFVDVMYFYLLSIVSDRLELPIDDLEYEILQKFGTLETFVYESLNWLESEWNLVDNNQLAFNFKMFFGEGKEINL